MSAEQAQTLLQRLTDIRRYLHERPELSNEEIETTKAIKSWLTEAGIRIVDYHLPTGVVAELGQQSGSLNQPTIRDQAVDKSQEAQGKKHYPVVALRADIDALPIHEETGLSFASKINGRMHACGHDFHTASLLGAAFLLKERESELKGTVRLLFQPAEEKATGAQQLIRKGVLDQVDAIFGIHNKPDIPVGTIGVRKGPLMAAADGFEVEVKGIGSHAAAPESGIDPIVIASHMVTALQAIVSRNVSALESAVISVTRIHAGTSWNVISDKAIFDGTIRTFTHTVRDNVRQRFEQVIHGVAAAFGTTAVVKWIEGPPAVINDARWTKVVNLAARSQGLLVVEPSLSPAGEDFAFYLQKTPGAFLFIGTNGPQQWHHPAFDIDEAALPDTAKLLAATAIEALNELSSEIT